jgi:tetratricopeptide (TPR) repeat protein
VSSLANVSIPKPKDWQSFERSITVLMACVLDDPNTTGNGRSGQPQSGVDVYGYRNRELAELVGVQCKKKMDAKVTEKELRDEVGKAKKFRPKLKEFILATTAPRDQAIQTVARTITYELSKTEYPIRVVVWGWDDIEEHASKYENAYHAFDPTFNPYAKRTYEKIEAKLHEIIDHNKSGIQAAPQPTDVTVDAGKENTPLHGQISAYFELIDDGHVQTALTQLEKIRANAWATASQSERYRLLVAFAAAKLKNEDYSTAGKLLLDAFAECPEHKKAKQNRAKGYLLTNDYARAGKIALEVIQSDPGNADAASTLIQARMHDPACQAPLDDIPAALLETEDVLIARVHFLRFSGDMRWLPLARQAAKKYPASRHLRVVAAESVLEDLTKNDRDVLAGAPVRVVSQDELEAAVKALAEEALNAIQKGLQMPSYLANNASLALRFAGDIPTATQILDAAIAQRPDDENLRFQRAILAYAQNDLTKVLELIPENPSNPEAIPIRATALADTGKPDDALKLIDGFDASAAPDHVRFGIIAARCHAYLVRNEKNLAIETARKEALADPGDMHVAGVLIRTYYLAGENDAASKALDAAVACIDEKAGMPSRLLLSFEAQRLDRHDTIVALLKGHVATNYDNEALRLLVASAINGHFWVTAQETLDTISPRLQDLEWVQRARAILALNIGSRDAEQKVGAYLKKWPNDASMILARIGMWQRTGRDKDIAAFASSIDFGAVHGSTTSRIRLAAIACRYGSAARGLDYGYSVLMDNWDQPSAHLTYQGLILLNEHIAPVLPPSSVVAENTVVFLTSEDGQRVYRLEQSSHKFFEDERLDLDSDLAKLLLGRKVGDSFLLQQRVGAKPVTITDIKPVYIDAFHRSTDQFNERFPSAKGMMKFTFDVTAADPLENMRAITKQRAESDQALLEHYRSMRVPLAFVAAIMGRDPLEAWTGLPSVNTRFKVCHGVHQEREEALRLLKRRERKGCVLDAITLSVIRRLGVGDAVVSVCGPLHTPQSILDLLASRAIETANEVDKAKGFISWRDGQLIMQEYTEEMLKNAAEQSEAERAWAFANVAVVIAMPKQEFSPETHAIVEMMGEEACDPVVAADGSGLLLLSDDMELRNWAGTAFGVSATWLQPVLVVARHEGKLSQEKYFEAINTLTLSGHSYTSLEPGALVHQARKSEFDVTDNLRRLLEAVGGPTSDLRSNCKVVAEFLDLVMQECTDDLKVMRIASHAFESMAKGRIADQREIVARILQHITTRPEWMGEHGLAWLIGHSIGMPDHQELGALQIKSKARRSRQGAK